MNAIDPISCCVLMIRTDQPIGWSSGLNTAVTGQPDPYPDIEPEPMEPSEWINWCQENMLTGRDFPWEHTVRHSGFHGWGLFLRQEPPRELLEEFKQRALAYAARENRPGPRYTIIGFELTKLTLTVTSNQQNF